MRKLSTLGSLSLDASKQAISDPVHLTFAQRQPKVAQGQQTLVLSADLYTTPSTSKVTLRVVSGEDTKQYALSQVKLTDNDGDLLRQSTFVPTSKAGEYVATITVGLKGHLALVAYPSTRSSAPEVSKSFYASLPTCSNPIVIVSTKSSVDISDDTEESASKLTDDIIQSILAPMSGLFGSQEDFFKMRGMTPTSYRNPEAEHQVSRQTLEKSTEDLASRIAGYSDFLKQNHAEEEVKALAASLPIEQKDRVKKYSDALTEGSNSITSSLEPSKFNPATGNVTSQNIGNQNITSAKYQLNASTAMDLRAPLFVSSSQVSMTDAKDHHTRAYLKQTSSVHTWHRAEEDLTFISKAITNYGLSSCTNMAKESSDIAGDKYIYGDSVLMQVGLGPPVALALKVAELKGSAANEATDAAVDSVTGGASEIDIQGQVDKIIEEVNGAARDLTFLVQDNFKAYTLKGDCSLSAGKDFIGYANSAMFLRSNSVASLDSSIVFINCKVIRPPDPPPKPRVNTPFVPIDKYSKTSLPSEGSTYQVGMEDRIPTTF